MPYMWPKGNMERMCQPGWLGMLGMANSMFELMARADSITPFGSLVVPDV